MAPKAPKFQAAWLTKSDDEVSLHCNAFFFLPALSQYCGKREHQCGGVVYLKTVKKPFTQNAYLLQFLAQGCQTHFH